jgi:hypothetical protein
VTFSGIIDRAALVAAAQRLMAIRPHRDAGPDGVTEIVGTGTNASRAGLGRQARRHVMIPRGTAVIFPLMRSAMSSLQGGADGQLRCG